jgi:hypothetical protein
MEADSMRREFIQVIAVFAIALGAGLFAFGRHLDPPMNAGNPLAVQGVIHDEDQHIAASMATGAGVALITFGVLSILLPWFNDALAKRRERSDDPVRHSET